MEVLRVNCLLPTRLDKYLMQQYPVLTPGRLNKALRENKIKLNGKKQPLSTRVQAGDEIKLFLLPDQLNAAPPVEGPAFLQAKYPAKVVYENDQLLIADKPAGLPVNDESDPDTLIHRVQLYLYKKGEYRPGEGFVPALCHRLDTGTSGLVLVAKTSQALADLTELIRARRLKKEYLCVTFGRPEPPAATLTGWLKKDAAKGRVTVVDRPAADAVPIETRYETMAVSGRLALLRVELITGRTHQIRAHLASIGCPILGDGKYGQNTVNRQLHFKYQALCAWRLTFPSDCPPSLASVNGKCFTLEKPWYCRQLLDGELK